MLSSRLTAPVICAFVTAGLYAGSAETTALVSCPTVPPGGTAQITVSLASPIGITHGKFRVELDSAVFGDISAVHVFSASGDQQGLAQLQGRVANVFFDSNSGGIGRLPNLPVAEITASVLDTAPVGVGAVAVQASTPWRAASGRQVIVSFQSPGVTVGDGISIQSVTPGGGPVPAGTLAEIRGRGFTTSTQLRLDGVTWSNLQFVSGSLLTFMLTGPTDLTGKLVELNDGSGASTRYYSNFTPASIQDETGKFAYWPIFPAVTFRRSGGKTRNMWLRNDSPNAIDVVLSPSVIVCTPCRGFTPAPSRTIRVPAGGLYMTDYNFNGGFPADGTVITASAPLRVLRGLVPSNAPLGELAPFTLTPYLQGSGPTFMSCDDSFPFYYRAGDAPPPPIACEVTSPSLDTISAGTDDGNPWLRASPVAGSKTKFTVSVDPAGLSLGPHNAVITAVVSGDKTGWASKNLRINVLERGTITANGTGLNLYFPYSRTESLTITSGNTSVPISVSSSEPWLIVTSATAVTPATLTIRAAPGTPGNKSAVITIRGPGNTLSIPVQTSTSLAYRAFRFEARAGETRVRSANVTRVFQADVKVETNSAGKWLSAAVVPWADSQWMLTINADPTGLASGVYRGEVTFATYPGPEPHLDSVPVTFSIWTDPEAPPTVTPPSLAFDRLSSGALNVSTRSISVPFTVSYEAEEGLNLYGTTSGITPELIYVSCQVDYPGTYHGSVKITVPGGNYVTVPVACTVSPYPLVDANHPTMAAIVNAASLLPGPIAPGEIVSIFGLVTTPGMYGVTIGSDGKVNRSHYGNRVLFNGVPAPLTYASATRIDAAVPYEIAGSAAVTVEIDSGGVHSPPWTAPAATSAPGVFTPILNENNTPNSALNPAARGSVIQIFLTGEGSTSPQSITGEITRSNAKGTSQPLRVQIGGVEAKIVSAASAPNTIAGVFQVNTVIPESMPAGEVPVMVRIGEYASQTAVGVSVE